MLGSPVTVVPEEPKPNIAAVGTWLWIAAAVDLSAPFLVVEEEGLGIAGLELYRAADVETEGVVAEFGFLVVGLATLSA